MRIKWNKPEISTVNVIGNRPYNEDRLSTVKLSDTLTLLTVCDGHGGYRCADFAINWFPNQVRDLLRDMSPNEAILKRALTSTIDAWDALSFKGKPPSSQEDLDDMFDNGLVQDHGIGSGTTLVACLIDTENNMMYTISLGDSRADWQFGETVDQKLNPEYLKTLENKFTARAHIYRNRVNGILAIGHAIGNNGYNMAGLMCRVPYTSKVSLSPSNKRKRTKPHFQVIIASDGLWDTTVKSGSKELFKLNHAKEMLPVSADDNVSIIHFSLKAK